MAGGADDRVRFSADAVEAVFRVSGGTPRVVNLVCDRALYRGHLARKTVIDPETVTQAIDDLGVGTLTPAPSFAVAPTCCARRSESERCVSSCGSADRGCDTTGRSYRRRSWLDAAGRGSDATDRATPFPQISPVSRCTTSTNRFTLRQRSTAPVYTKHSIFGPKRPRLRWRWRVLRWAATATAVLAIVFVALLGEAVFIHYFPSLADQDLRLPACAGAAACARDDRVGANTCRRHPASSAAGGLPRRARRGAFPARVNRISRAEFREAIRRGWSKRCPHCGQGALFIGWNKPYRHCPVCGYLYERDYGDVWWVWIVTDRIPIGIGIVLLYFGFRVRSFWMGVLFFGSLSLPLLLTIPRRYGLAIAITYLIRKRWPDPKDTLSGIAVVTSYVERLPRLLSASRPVGSAGRAPIEPP